MLLFYLLTPTMWRVEWTLIIDLGTAPRELYGRAVFWLIRIFLDMISYKLDSAIYLAYDRVLKHFDFHRERTSITTLIMLVYKNMTREYSLGVGRCLVVKQRGDVYSIMVFQMKSDNRRLGFPMVRWSSFTRAIYEIDNAVDDLKTNLPLKYSYHIGGGYYLSVIAG